MLSLSVVVVLALGHLALATPVQEYNDTGEDHTLLRGTRKAAAARSTRALTVSYLEKVDLKKHPYARCQDGSPGAYYINRGRNPNSWVIQLLGGGSCASQKDCSERSISFSSSDSYRPYYAKSPGIPNLFAGALSSDKEDNPDFADWNHVRVMYCSSDWYLGTLNGTVAWNTTHFSGHNILRAIIGQLIEKDYLDKADTLILGGESAGGIGSIANLDYVASMLPDVKVVGLINAGFYFSVANASVYRGPDNSDPSITLTPEELKKVYDLYKAYVPERCAIKYPEEPWKCILAGTSFATLATPAFIVQNLIDPVQRDHSGTYDCNDNSETMAWCKEWVTNLSQHLDLVSHRGESDRGAAGLFAPACQSHTAFDGTKINGTGYLQAFGDWLLRPGTQYIYENEVAPIFLKCSKNKKPKLQKKLQQNPTCPEVKETSGEELGEKSDGEAAGEDEAE